LIVAHHPGFVLLTIDREERRNALDAKTSAALDREIQAAEKDPAIAAIVLTGSGGRAFCSGMDMKEAAEIGAGHGLIPGRGFGGITEARRRKPLIVAVNGAAVAGGMEIALAAEIVIAADHAVFGLSEVKRGLFAFAGGIQRLARAVPRAAGLGIILTGEPVSAMRAHALGLVTEVVAAAELLPRALSVAEAIAGFDREAITNAKLLYDLSADSPVNESLSFGRAFGEATLASARSQDGVVAYAQKHGTQS
jgi:enoyl-CoA hydratase/carnithine racemase